MQNYETSRKNIGGNLRDFRFGNEFLGAKLKFLEPKT